MELMSTYDLTPGQMEELKQEFLSREYETMGVAPSYGELLAASETVSDECIHEEYEGVIFSEDDFFCKAA